MQTFSIAIHSILRYAILIALFIAVYRYFSFWRSGKAFEKSDSKLSLILMIIADLTAVFGLLNYFVYSSLTRTAFNDFGAAMKDSSLRFWAVEHIFGMVIAIVLIHLAKNQAKKSISDEKKHKRSFVYLLIALAIMLISIPWGAARWDFVW